MALRWARAGHEVVIGSRRAEKAERVAGELTARLDGAAVITGLPNPAAAAACEVAVLSVPHGSQEPILQAIKEQLVGKLLISVVVPLKPPKVAHVWRPEAGSAAQEAQAFLGSAVHVVGAFQNVSADHLADPDAEIDCDVLVCGNKRAQKAVVEQLVVDAGMRPVDAGPLVNASVVEGLTALLIGINRRYQVKGAGIRVTGLVADAQR